MSRKITGFALSALLVALASVRLVQPQLPGKIPWIGYPADAGSGPSPSFIQGLGDLGYVEGKNIGIVFRTSESRSERYPDLAAEVVRLKVDVIVADGTNAALAAKKATSSVPIVMASSTDPVGTGLVASVARPGGNVTGLTTLTEELGGKQLELLKEVVAGLNRVAISIRVIHNARNEVRNEEGCGAINPCGSGAGCCCGHSRGAAAEEGSADRICVRN